MASNNSDHWVYAKIRAGLGNRMFMLVAGYIVHRSNNLPLHILYVSDNPHSKTNYIDTLFNYFPINSIEPTNVQDSTLIQQSDKTFAPWNPITDKTKCRLEGFYQYYPVIKPYESEIRTLFLKGLNTIREDLLQKYTFDSTGFIHIRRGDYLKYSHFYIQPVEYYKKAVELITKKNPTCKFYIVSDDITWVKTEPFFKNDIFVIYEGNELETLALMSLSTAAAICANSTFSWWGAFLGAYEKRNPIICPKNFVKLPMCENIYPEEWIIK